MKRYLFLLFLPLFLFGAPDLTVTNLHMTTPDDGRPNPAFVWDANGYADGYQISSDDGVHWIDVGSATVYTFSGLSDGDYSVVVRAYARSHAIPIFGAAGMLALVSLLGLTAMRRIRRKHAMA